MYFKMILIHLLMAAFAVASFETELLMEKVNLLKARLVILESSEDNDETVEYLNLAQDFHKTEI